jgi:hypothetical protein
MQCIFVNKIIFVMQKWGDKDDFELVFKEKKELVPNFIKKIVEKVKK